jgi:hypothetical protein
MHFSLCFDDSEVMMKARLIAVCHLLTLVVGVSGIAIVSSSVHADSLRGTPAVFPTNAVIFGATYSQWSAAWQQWANSIPAAEHPLFDNADCSKGQSGPVWFLGGKFCSSEDPACPSGQANRSCSVPRDKALYFPIVNYGCLNLEAEKGLCGDAGPFITQMRAAVADGIDQAISLQVTLDGKAIKDNLKKDFRMQSPVYTSVLPEGNLLQEIGENAIGAGTYWGVDDGVYIMLEPLPPGFHTLKFRGAFPNGFTLDITYKLKVQ